MIIYYSRNVKLQISAFFFFNFISVNFKIKVFAHISDFFFNHTCQFSEYCSSYWGISYSLFHHPHKSGFLFHPGIHESWAEMLQAFHMNIHYQRREENNNSIKGSKTSNCSSVFLVVHLTTVTSRCKNAYESKKYDEYGPAKSHRSGKINQNYSDQKTKNLLHEAFSTNMK